MRLYPLHFAFGSLCAAFALATGIEFATAQTAKTPANALSAALHGTQASGVVLDIKTGNVLATEGPAHSGTPGSVTKPLWLAYALEHGIVRPETEVYCRRNLSIGYRNLACTHPADQTVFTAETALAESCNTWFAELGRRYTGVQLEGAMEAVHLPHSPMADATTEQRQLAVLGLTGVTASPLQLALAYRALLLHVPNDSPVLKGLRDSVGYGMANPAGVAGLPVLGKTGTASNPGETWTHGWFAGALANRYVVVIYVPHGDGGTAARLAHTFFSTAPIEGKSH